VRQLAQLGIGPPRVVERLGNDRLRVSILVVESLLSEARRIRARPRAMGSVGRDLDERTRRIMTYLAVGPRMKFFAVEVDYFRAGDGPSVVLVPRTAFVPSWVAEPSPPAGSSSSAATISLTTCFSGSPNSPG
jgi:hypothetical protein